MQRNLTFRLTFTSLLGGKKHKDRKDTKKFSALCTTNLKDFVFPARSYAANKSRMMKVSEYRDRVEL
jgi:hypothetical protein